MLLPLALLATLSIYGLHQSYNNITRLQKYEEQSEKAVKWSNTVAERLHKTRSTQTSGTISLLVSLVTALYLLFVGAGSKVTLVSAAGVNVAALFASRAHMAGFWNEGNQVQVPFVEKFNEAIKGSERVVGVLGLLGVAWLGVGFLWLFGFTGL